MSLRDRGLLRDTARRHRRLVQFIESWTSDIVGVIVNGPGTDTEPLSAAAVERKSRARPDVSKPDTNATEDAFCETKAM